MKFSDEVDIKFLQAHDDASINAPTKVYFPLLIILMAVELRIPLA